MGVSDTVCQKKKNVLIKKKKTRIFKKNSIYLYPYIYLFNFFFNDMIVEYNNITPSITQQICTCYPHWCNYCTFYSFLVISRRVANNVSM